MDESDDEDIEEGSMSGGEEYAELEIDPEDHKTLDALAPSAQEGNKTLADLIFAQMQGGAVSQGIEEEGESTVQHLHVTRAHYRRGTPRSTQRS